uniref:hypothetical protein n=1 Tax=Herbaspirillum lusitanum TaxID=213312 RepID=UPI00058D2ED3
AGGATDINCVQFDKTGHNWSLWIPESRRNTSFNCFLKPFVQQQKYAGSAITVLLFFVWIALQQQR